MGIERSPNPLTGGALESLEQGKLMPKPSKRMVDKPNSCTLFRMLQVFFPRSLSSRRWGVAILKRRNFASPARNGNEGSYDALSIRPLAQIIFLADPPLSEPGEFDQPPSWKAS